MRNPTCSVPSEWLNQAENICYETKNDNYASFSIKRNCTLVAMRLSHVTGYLTCDLSNKTAAARWGCSNKPDNPFGTIIMDPRGDNILWAPDKHDNGFYELPGFNINDDVVTFKKTSQLRENDIFQIWFGGDRFKNNNKHATGGKHCVDVDISCWI